MSKLEQYEALVARRKSYDPTPFGLKNPSTVADGEFDSNYVGPWTRWAHDLNANVMVVGQDWGDVRYFEQNRGLDQSTNPTNKALKALLMSVGATVPEPPALGAIDGDAERGSCGVWLTNACLWLKDGGMSAPVKREWFGEHSADFLRAQIDLVEPRIVIALGSKAYDCLISAHDKPLRKGVFRMTVENAAGVQLNAKTKLVGVYHCGARIQNTVRSHEQQLKDWARIRPLVVV